jgi:hypothetical protein
VAFYQGFSNIYLMHCIRGVSLKDDGAMCEQNFMRVDCRCESTFTGGGVALVSGGSPL